MALETAVFQQDPFSYGCLKDSFNLKQEYETSAKSRAFRFSATCSSPDNGFATGGAPPCRWKRGRNNSVNNREEIEYQRMTHIVFERNRTKQMNDYLAVLKSMMRTSYVQRGDQASIIGGAINFVKELEQLLQSLEAQKRTDKSSANSTVSSILSGFFYFPQYSTASTTTTHRSCGGESMASSSSASNVEVTTAESHANLKILTKTALENGEWDSIIRTFRASS